MLLRNPKARGWVILGSIVYLLSPIDLAPDLLPLLGQIDDIALVALLFSELSKQIFEGWRGGAFADPSVSSTGPTDADRDYTQTVDVPATSGDRPADSAS